MHRPGDCPGSGDFARFFPAGNFSGSSGPGIHPEFFLELHSGFWAERIVGETVVKPIPVRKELSGFSGNTGSSGFVCVRVEVREHEPALYRPDSRFHVRKFSRKILSIRYPLGRKSFLFHLTHYLPIDMAEENIYRLIQARKDEIARVAREYGASRIRIFGSVARHTADNGSDIDFLVDLAPDRTLFDLGGLAYDLEQLLGRPVDVCTVPLLREPIRTRVIEEAIPL